MSRSCQIQALNQNEGKPDLCDTAVSMEEIQLSSTPLTAVQHSCHSQGLHGLLSVLHDVYICVKTVLKDSGQSLRYCRNPTHTAQHSFMTYPR